MRIKGRPSPQFPLYVDDWLGSKYILLMTSYEERGYMRLLMHMWNTPGCRLENDPNSLAQWSLLGKKWFNGSGKKILQCFVLRGRFWYNKRLKKEWDKQWSWKDKCSKAGRESGKIRRQNNLQTNYPSKDSSTTLEGRGELNANFPIPIPIPIPNKKKESIKKKENSAANKPSKNPLSPFSEITNKKNPFRDQLPYNHSKVVADRDYAETAIMYSNALDDCRILKDAEALRVNAALAWAHYRMKTHGGTKFQASAEAIEGYLLCDYTVEDLQKEIERYAGPKNVPIWDVLKPLQQKAIQRAAAKVEEDKLKIQRELQREKDRELKKQVAEIEKQNEEDRERWEKENPGIEFPKPGSLEYIKFVCPEIPEEDIAAFAQITGKSDPSSKRGKTKKIGQVVTELIDTGPPVKG